MTDCNSNIVTWHNVCDPYNYEATFSSASATIYLNGLCVYEGVIVEGNTYPIINLNIGVNEVRIVYGSSCVIFYIETYYEVGEEIAFNSSTLLLQEEEVCDPCGTNVPSIPFATLLLNGDEFLEVFINTITDIILIYENGTEVVPLSVVDNVITLSNPGEGGDATYDLEDENGNTISSGSIVCGENEIIIAPNATVTYNGGTVITAIQSNQSEDLTFEYENGDAATPTTQLGTVLTFPNPQASYDPRDKVDFFTLNWTNPFGNNSRFTALDGTQTYTAGVAIDWTSYNIPNTTVVCYYTTLYKGSTGTLASAIAYAAILVVGGLSVWKVGTFEEIAPLANDVDWYNYSPFSIVVGATNTRVRMNSFNDGATTIVISSHRQYLGEVVGASRNHLLTRVTTLSELGL